MRERKEWESSRRMNIHKPVAKTFFPLFDSFFTCSRLLMTAICQQLKNNNMCWIKKGETGKDWFWNPFLCSLLMSILFINFLGWLLFAGGAHKNFYKLILGLWYETLNIKIPKFKIPNVIWFPSLRNSQAQIFKGLKFPTETKSHQITCPVLWWHFQCFGVRNF